MNVNVLTPLLRMFERSLIVAGGILSIYFGYKLFVIGVDKAQGSASAFGVELKNFGPGLFFAALGAVILVTTMRASIKVGYDANRAAVGEKASINKQADTLQTQPAEPSSTLFFGLEDPERMANQWTETSFFLETRQLLRRIEKGESIDELKDLRDALQIKLQSVTMSEDEYRRYLELTQKIPLEAMAQKELLKLEGKLFP